MKYEVIFCVWYHFFLAVLPIIKRFQPSAVSNFLGLRGVASSTLSCRCGFSVVAFLGSAAFGFFLKKREIMDGFP